MDGDEATITAVIRCVRRSEAFLREQVADLSDEELLLQPAGAPNNAAWTLGHVILSCHELAALLGAAAWLPGTVGVALRLRQLAVAGVGLARRVQGRAARIAC